MREHFLKLLGCMMNDIKHNFIDTISAERILQWRVTVQELILVEFAVDFLLARDCPSPLLRKAQPVVDAIDTRIKSLKKEVANLEARRKRLLSDVTSSTRFED